MDFRIPSRTSFALAIGWRALLAASLCFAIIRLLTVTQYYAPALVLAGLAALTLLDMVRILTRLDAPLARVIEALNEPGEATRLRGTEQPAPGGALVDRTIALLQAERKMRARQADMLQALLDTVSVALIVVQPGSIRLVNRAARMLAGEEVGRLGDIAAIGPETAHAILALAPGARQIVALANGQQMLAAMAHFRAPGVEDQRLLSLQSVAGELDAVQLKAWQDMTRVLAHEMMNSLTPISSLSESLSHILRSGEGASQDAADAVEIIGRRSLGLMDFVGRYRKIADLPQPRLQRVALAEFIAGIDTLMRAGLSAKGIAYGSTVETGSMVAADPDLLSQAVINLLHNAADAVTGAVQPQIRLVCRRQDGQMLLEVTDNGAGLAAEQLDDIFVPFFTTKQGGSGIGLTLARQIALAHQGQIEVRPNDGAGMTFTLRLPAV